MNIGRRREDDFWKRNKTRKRILKPLLPLRIRFNRISAISKVCPLTKESPKINEDVPH